jgi:hypothetical protein
MEENKAQELKAGKGMHVDQHSKASTQNELLNLQMPDHRRAVPVVDDRPESKKGHDLISKEQLAKMTRESKLKFTPYFFIYLFINLVV